MSHSQTPSITLQGASMEEENEKSAQSKIGSKVHIGRSNSAPQPKSRFSLTQKMNKASSPKKQQSMDRVGSNGTSSPLATLSDGVISVEENQAAQSSTESVMATSQHDSLGEQSGVSSVPLCDSNHSPTKTKRLQRQQQSSEPLGEEPGPDDVWQLQDNSGTHDSSRCLSKSDRGNISRLSQYKESLISNGSVAETSNQTNGALSQSARLNSEEENSNNSASPSPSSETADSSFQLRRNPQRRQVRHAHSEVLPSEMQRKMSLVSVTEKGYARLEEELSKAQKALEMKDEEVDELRGIRERLMKEVSDFTASLFEEVNSQLNEAALNEQQAKKQLNEANHKIEMLSAEVAALKNLVLTSTPAKPNKHLHPQINNGASAGSGGSTSKKEKGGRPFWMTHRRSTSHHQYTKESMEREEASQHHAQLKEMDTVVYDEFARWRLQPTMEMSSAYFTRVHQEDIQPCLNFKNSKLADKLQQNVMSNTLSIEPIPGDHSYPRKCSLSETHKLCNYKIKFEGDDEWHSISQMARNRIAAVCDFYSYVRYIVQGLVKCPDKDMFAELVRLRHRMAQARLGII